MEAIVVPCTERKIWHSEPARGATAARDACTGPSFERWRAYAERAGGEWFILSTKHGFLRPADLVLGPYDVPVSRAAKDVSFLKMLRIQGHTIDFSRFERVVLLDAYYFEPLVKAAVGDAAPCVLRGVVFKK